MRIHEHLAVEKMSAARWGRIVGITCRATAARYAKGERIPPREVIIRTFIWSGGKVRPDDWYDLPDLTALDQAEAA